MIARLAVVFRNCCAKNYSEVRFDDGMLIVVGFFLCGHTDIVS